MVWSESKISDANGFVEELGSKCWLSILTLITTVHHDPFIRTGFCHTHVGTLACSPEIPTKLGLEYRLTLYRVYANYT
jgi:hypothetical protein